MSTQMTAPESALLAWRHFLRTHCAITRQLDADLAASHGLTINDYDVLVQLRDAPQQRLRMSELADHVLLTRSGMTRLIDGLVRDELVQRASCPSDARVSYAQITQRGLETLDTARRTHLDGITRLFTQHFSEAESQQLADLLGRLPGSQSPMPCEGSSDATGAC